MAQELESASHLVMQDLQKVCLQDDSSTGESMGSVRQMEHASCVFSTGARPVSKKVARVGRAMIVLLLLGICGEMFRYGRCCLPLMVW